MQLRKNVIKMYLIYLSENVREKIESKWKITFHTLWRATFLLQHIHYTQTHLKKRLKGILRVYLCSCICLELMKKNLLTYFVCSRQIKYFHSDSFLLLLCCQTSAFFPHLLSVRILHCSNSSLLSLYHKHKNNKYTKWKKKIKFKFNKG